VTAEVFHAEGGADRHDEANDRFPWFWESAEKGFSNGTQAVSI